MNLSFVSCQQKKFFIVLPKLDEKELRIHYGKKNHPPLSKDKEGNLSVNFDTSNVIYTSTNFGEVKDLRDIFCIKETNECLHEEYELEQKGFSITVNSHFNSTEDGKSPYDSFLIESIKKNRKK
jgi:hypothetical protein